MPNPESTVASASPRLPARSRTLCARTVHCFSDPEQPCIKSTKQSLGLFCAVVALPPCALATQTILSNAHPDHCPMSNNAQVACCPMPDSGARPTKWRAPAHGSKVSRQGLARPVSMLCDGPSSSCGHTAAVFVAALKLLPARSATTMDTARVPLALAICDLNSQGLPGILASSETGATLTHSGVHPPCS